MLFPRILIETIGAKHAHSIYSEKGTDANAEAGAEFRHCAALALEHPYKEVSAPALCMSANLFPRHPFFPPSRPTRCNSLRDIQLSGQSEDNSRKGALNVKGLLFL